MFLYSTIVYVAYLINGAQNECLLKEMLQKLHSPGFDAALVKRVLRMVNMNEWKRHQTAPVLRVSSKSFDMGRRMPIVAKYLG